MVRPEQAALGAAIGIRLVGPNNAPLGHRSAEPEMFASCRFRRGRWREGCRRGWRRAWLLGIFASLYLLPDCLTSGSLGRFSRRGQAQALPSLGSSHRDDHWRWRSRRQDCHDGGAWFDSRVGISAAAAPPQNGNQQNEGQTAPKAVARLLSEGHQLNLEPSPVRGGSGSAIGQAIDLRQYLGQFILPGCGQAPVIQILRVDAHIQGSDMGGRTG
jgi:hypothetical protein